VAEAHVLAFEKPAAAGQRHLISNGAYSYQQVCDIIREKFPQLRGLTPEENPGTPLPSTYRLDTSKAIKQLGINFRSLEETIVGTVDSLLKVQKVAQ
jgi:nucleoside-diphosphate-sugar epimerase